MVAVAKREGAESGEIKHLADSRECKEGVKERRVSAAQLWLTAMGGGWSERRGRGQGRAGGGGGRDASQAFDVDHCRPNI